MRWSAEGAQHLRRVVKSGGIALWDSEEPQRLGKHSDALHGNTGGEGVTLEMLFCPGFISHGSGDTRFMENYRISPEDLNCREKIVPMFPTPRRESCTASKGMASPAVTTAP